MKTKTKIIGVATLLIVILFACKKEQFFEGEHDPEVIKQYSNKTTNSLMMDSIEAVNFIAKQKLREVYEISALLATTDSSEVELKSILKSQLATYFLENDSVKINNLLLELDTLKVSYTTVSTLGTPIIDSIMSDSVQQIKYKVDYYSKNKKKIQSKDKTAIVVLKKEPIKFKYEFKFYFSDLDSTIIQKDSIPEVVTQ